VEEEDISSVEECGTSPGSTPTRDDSIYDEPNSPNCQFSSSSSSPKSPLNLSSLNTPVKNSNETTEKDSQDKDYSNTKAKAKEHVRLDSQSSNTTNKEEVRREVVEKGIRETTTETVNSKESEQLDNFGTIVENIKSDLNDPFKLDKLIKARLPNLGLNIHQSQNLNGLDSSSNPK